jgi:hypothetical protein
MRASMNVALVATAVAGCASAPPRTLPPSSEIGGRAPAAQRCSDADPNRSAWLCLIGRTLYVIAGGLQTDYWRAR